MKNEQRRSTKGGSPSDYKHVAMSGPLSRKKTADKDKKRNKK